MVLEGGGSEGAPELIASNHFDEVGDTAQYISVFPSGYYSNWADGRGVTESDTARIDDVGFLNALVDTISANYSIHANRVFVCGASNGGMMTQRLAIETPEKYAGFASIISSLPDSLAKKYIYRKKINMLLMNGTSDLLVPYIGGELNPITDGGSVVGTDSTINFWLVNNQCNNTALSITELQDINLLDNSTVSFVQYDTCNHTNVALYRINGGGHSIPGRENMQNPTPIIGYTNQDIDAAVEIWKFFKNKTNQTEPSTIRHLINTTDIKVFPNPTNSIFNIQFPKQPIFYSVKIYNMSGKKIKYFENTNQIDINEVNKGVYLLEIKTESETTIVKLIKN
jgi:polyhydroxybutyrate depolymerase